MDSSFQPTSDEGSLIFFSEVARGSVRRRRIPWPTHHARHLPVLSGLLHLSSPSFVVPYIRGLGCGMVTRTFVYSKDDHAHH